MQKLTTEEIQSLFVQLEGWAIEDGKLMKDFTFKDFKTAMDFMNHVAAVAEKLNHHPDWSNSYNKVVISLTTHDAGGLTNSDFRLAQAADKIAAQL
jgi:4a-hydroxytetrahydrobiopterin dehydratase